MFLDGNNHAIQESTVSNIKDINFLTDVICDIKPEKEDNDVFQTVSSISGKQITRWENYITFYIIIV